MQASAPPALRGNVVIDTLALLHPRFCLPPSLSSEMEADDGEEHVLDDVQHDGDAGGEKLRPNDEIEGAFSGGVDAEGVANDGAEGEGSGELAGPGSGRGDRGEAEVVGLVGVVEGEVRIYVLVGAEVEHQHASQEREHAHILCQRPYEHITHTHFLVRPV